MSLNKETTQIHKYFMLQTNLDMAKKEKLKKETESISIIAQNNAIRINHVKASVHYVMTEMKLSIT